MKSDYADNHEIEEIYTLLIFANEFFSRHKKEITQFELSPEFPVRTEEESDKLLKIIVRIEAVKLSKTMLISKTLSKIVSSYNDQDDIQITKDIESVIKTEKDILEILKRNYGASIEKLKRFRKSYYNVSSIKDMFKNLPEGYKIKIVED